MFKNFIVPVVFKPSEIKLCDDVLKKQPEIEEGN